MKTYADHRYTQIVEFLNNIISQLNAKTILFDDKDKYTGYSFNINVSDKTATNGEYSQENFCIDFDRENNKYCLNCYIDCRKIEKIV